MERVRRHHRLDRGMKGWIFEHAKKNYWRVAAWYELSDLVQDGFVCYAKCLERYRDVEDQAHFMALVKTTFTNHCHNLATKRSRTVEVTASDLYIPEGEEGIAFEDLAAPEPEEASLAVLIRQLPRELADLVSTLFEDGRELLDREPREGVNEWLCRIAGLSSVRYNVEEALRYHLGLTRSECVCAPAGRRLFYVDGELFDRGLK